MCNNRIADPAPVARYEALRLPDGSHSGVCVDRSRYVIEIQRKGVKYYFDLAILPQGIVKQENVCYDGAQGEK